MWKRVKDNFDTGIEKVKWFSSLLNERVKVEISLFKLLNRSSGMEKKRSELMRIIGERVFDLRRSTDKGFLRDPAIMAALNDIEQLDSELEDVRRQVSEIDRIEI